MRIAELEEGWPPAWNLGTEHGFRFGFYGPMGKPVLSEAEIRQALADNGSKLGQPQRVSLPRPLDPELREYFDRLDIIERYSPGKGFFLCFRAALVSALAYFHKTSDKFGIVDPALELEVRSKLFLAGSKSDSLIDQTSKRLELAKVLEPQHLLTLGHAKDLTQSIFQHGGVILIRHRLFFPALGKTLNGGDIKRFGHWVCMLDEDTLGGILNPYGLDGHFAKIDGRSVLENVDGLAQIENLDLLLHQSTRDAWDFNAWGFYPNRVEYLGL